ncbi:MAG TPA: hypothetical protein VFZ53_00790 [Polyangiaceae bacterium]
MKSLAIALSFALVSLAAASRAEAQMLGSKGDAIVGAERLFGIRGEHLEIDQPAPLDDTEIDATTISLGFADPLTPYNLPRVTFDYMIIDKLSIGGTLAFASRDADIEGPADPATQTDFALGPRVGFLHMFGRVLGIWPRAGLVYHSQSMEDVYDASTFGISLECMFPIVLVQHFGIIAGFAFDQALTGNLDPDDGPDQDLSYRSIGLQVGIFGWL